MFSFVKDFRILRPVSYGLIYHCFEVYFLYRKDLSKHSSKHPFSASIKSFFKASLVKHSKHPSKDYSRDPSLNHLNSSSKLDQSTLHSEIAKASFNTPTESVQASFIASLSEASNSI